MYCNYYYLFFSIAVQHERKPVSDRNESIHNTSTSPDNNNIPFSYVNNSFIKTEMSFNKNDLHFIKTEMPYTGHRAMCTDQAALHLMQSFSNIFYYNNNLLFLITVFI